MKLTGDEALMRKFKELPPKLQKKHGRRALTKAGRRIVKAAKPRINRRTGQLRKSLGQRSRTYKNTVTVIVGPRHGYATTDERGNVHDPAKIAHLVERGHGGPASAPAHPFLRPAMAETESSNKTLIAAELRKGLEEEAI